jgi:hypothetical protein
MRVRPIMVLVLAAALAQGAACDRSSQKQAKPITKTVVNPDPVTTAIELPATRPTSRPTSSTLTIGGVEFKFPAARVAVQQTEPQLSLLLFSDEPRAALAKDYAGNRYHLELNLDVPDANLFTSAEYTQKAASLAIQESPFGIFVDGDKRQLQPYDIRVFVQKQGEDIMLHLQGEFLSFDPRNERETPSRTRVEGVLNTRLEKQPK